MQKKECTKLYLSSNIRKYFPILSGVQVALTELPDPRHAFFILIRQSATIFLYAVPSKALHSSGPLLSQGVYRMLYSGDPNDVMVIRQPEGNAPAAPPQSLRM